jgi:hypothetical protein
MSLGLEMYSHDTAGMAGSAKVFIGSEKEMDKKKDNSIAYDGI